MTTAKLAADAVTASELSNNIVDDNKLTANAVITSKIADDAVTYAKIQNVSATDRILGRDSSGAGVVEEITPANLRTMINVADGAIDGSALNAANLSSGTIPDARFPATLPAISGANLTNLPGGTVGPGNEKLFVEAENQMDASFTTQSNFNYVAASPMTIASSATLTVSASSTMTFV